MISFNLQVNLPTGKTRWGGETGADLLTNYLRPEKFTLFTDLKKNDFIKGTRLMPDPNGEIEVYETFWEKGNAMERCVPPLLVYADLIINGDKRSIEIAQRIYDRYIQE
ncbi:type IV toxin-antitoxin system AbiEi family antitoxin [Mongoliibacter sp.]|uniref:type IV toxin-antitoxin system AbiEi family antitoxin n=1 Tax=Mongoliibacter sp. TaxID=2022438 RepID=UPI0025D11CAA|nr:type IV toxin-antitoxin system AbiEi family antitoxin [Mongoliibacter sp.]